MIESVPDKVGSVTPQKDGIMQLELSDRPFVLYKSARRGCLSIVYRRKDGDYASLDIKEGDL